MKVMRYSAVALVAIGICVNVSNGMFRFPQYLPVERLIENATAYTKKEPNNASGYYILGRIHYMAFVDKSFLIAAYSDDIPPAIIPFWRSSNYMDYARRQEAIRIALEEYGYESTSDIPEEGKDEFWVRVSSIKNKLENEDWRPEQPTTEQLIEHSGAAQWNFYQATALDPNNGLYYLGQASLGEQYYEFFTEAGMALMPSALKTIFLNGVKETYFLAYDLAIHNDLDRERIPIEGLHGLVSYEAGNAFIRLWELEDQIPSEVQDRIADIKANIAVLEALPMGGITPIIFSLQKNSSLTQLLAPQKIVDFDLDGDGVVEKRPWVKSSVGFLVWDGNGDGKITSGRELFGSVTWWLFFKDGYRAMDLLDDNRDGFLTGPELDGISVWFDRNSNGCSDVGEVVPVGNLEITKIATRPNSFEGKSPIHTAGIQFKDGRTLPTYDWIAPSVQSYQEALLP